MVESMSPLSIGDFFFLIVSGIIFGFLGLFLAYPMGLFPAGIAGLIYWGLLTKFNTNPMLPIRLITGALLGMLCTTSFGGLLFSPDDAEASRLSLIAWAAAGFFGGAISAASIGTKTFQLANKP